MESDPGSSKSTNQDKISKFLSQRKSYLMGVVLGITLITVNFSIGLYVVDLVTSEANVADSPTVEPQHPVPKINEENYQKFKDDFLDRQVKEIREVPSLDPFKTG